MNKDTLLQALKQETKNAVQEVITSSQEDLVAIIKEELEENLLNAKTALVNKLKENIANSSNYAEKLKNYLLLLVVQVVEVLFRNLQAYILK